MTEDRMERWDANSLMGRPPSTHNMVVESENVLSTRVGIEGINMNLYRLVILARLIVVGFFFHLRITKPVKDGYGLWITAVVCEIWLAVSWILDQLPKWSPINRLTHLDRLSTRFEKEGEREGEECCGLASVDVMVSTEDPVREAPLMTANAVLSVLALDYPARKVSCYVSDDASAMLTFECLSETAEFARRWVPFCKEFNIEPRAPEPYFSHKIDYLRDKVKPEFVKRRRQMKREYDEFKVGINALVKKREKAPDDGWMMQDGTPWPGNNPRNHPGMIQVFLGRTGTLDVRGNELPLLVYMSREKKPGYHHYNKPGAMNALVRVSGVLTNSPYIMNMDCTHYINNSKVVREAMCFMMDSLIGRNISYVQFPLRFHALQQGNKYSSHNSVFYDITMKGLDGIQGPICLGTACVIRRQALYGYVPPPLVQHHSQSLWSYCLGNFSMRAKQHRFTTCSKILRAQIDLENSYEYDYDLKESLNPIQNLEDCLGQSPVYIASTMMEEGGIPEAIDPSSLIKEAIHVINCTYEEKTKWGKEIGWIYGSLTYNVLTGMKMHARGWQSVYCVPFRPAFKVNETMNLADSLREVLHRALGSMEILLSKHCPLWYRWRSGQMDCLQRIAYINIVVYPLASLPLIGYCFLPAVCLLTGKFIVSPLDNIGIMWVTGLLTSVMACAILELKWSQVEIEEWWRNQQFWVIGGTSSHFFAILQGLLKVLTGIETSPTDTSHSKPTCEKQGDADDLKEMYKFKWTNLLIIPTTLVIVNILAVVAGISATFNSGYEAWESLSIKLCFAFWVLVHLYPFLRGLLGRQNRTPTIVIIWSTLLASIFSLLWIRADPFIQENKVA